MSLLDSAGKFTPEFQSLCGAGLALIASLLLAFFWVHASISDSKHVRTWMGSRPVFALLTGTGTLLLARWDIDNAGPVHGLLWVAGCAIATFATRAFLVRDYCADATTLPKSRQHEFKAFVKRTLFQQGHGETEKAALSRCKTLQKETTKATLNAVEELHLFIHAARDNAMIYTSEYRKLMLGILKGTITMPQYQEQIKQAHYTYVRNTLNGLVTVFETLIGQRGIWTAIRVCEQSNGSSVYRTLVRCGKVNNDRDQHSMPIRDNEGLPKYLLDQYKKGRGIVILGDQRGAKIWQRTENDARNEDRSVMAGPVMIKTPRNGSNPEKAEMYMILYVNSPDRGVFRPEHEQFMRCCTDVLSMFFSMALTVVREGVQERPTSSASDPKKGLA